MPPVDFHRKVRFKKSGSHVASLIAMYFSLLISSCVPLATCQSVNATNEPGTIFNGSQVVVNRDVPMSLSEGRGVRFRHLSTENGLSEASVVAGIQDDLGFLWFATQFGLNRFDGYTFKTYKHELGNKASLACVNVRTLFKDHAGNLWVACDESLDRFNPSDETFVHYPLCGSHSPDKLVIITSIQEDDHHALWITTHSGLYRLNPETGQTQRFVHNPNDLTTLNSDNADYIAEDEGKYSWVAAGKELNRFDRNLGKVTLHVSFTVPHTILGIHKDTTGTTWITRTDPECAIAQLYISSGVLNCLHIEDGNGEGVMHGGAYSMFEGRDGRMWFATAVDGLMEYDRVKGQIIRYRNQAKDDGSLGSNSIQFVTDDRDGGMWVGLHTGGIDRFSLTDPEIQTFIQDRGNIAGNLVTSIYEDHHGVLWIGSFGALNRIDRLHGENVVPMGPGVKGEVFLSIVEDGKGRLLTGTFRDGIQQLDAINGKFKKLVKPLVSPDAAKYPITRLLFDEHGTLWAATRNGLVRIDPLTGKPTLYAPNGGAVEFTDIKEDGHGDFWLSGSAGLHRFDPVSKTFRAYKRLTDGPREISDNHTNFVHIDRVGRIWVGTQNGLAELDPASGNFTNYYESDGLAGDVVGGILEDEHGRLWLGTNHGLSRFNPTTHKFVTVYVGDGVTEPDLTGWSACFKSPDGEMFFGGYGGAIAFHPDQIVDDRSAPLVELTDFQVGGISISPGKGSPLTTSTSFVREVVLKHSQDMFSVTFSALKFNDPAHIRYRYMLEGIDKSWHQVNSSQRTATYTMLPPGDYVVHVQASTSSSPWTEPGRTLKVRILQPWWGTWWFRSFYLMLAMACAWIAYRYRLHSLSKSLALRLQARTEERTRLSRELHDTLMQTIEASRMVADYAAKQQTDPAQHRAALEQLSTWLEKASNQGRETMRTLRGCAKNDSDLYFDLKQVVEECNRQHTIEVAFPVTASSRLIRPLIQEEIFHIGSEAIRNACTHADATRIDVQLHFERDLSLSVKDNGKGMSSAVASLGKKGHFGLRGMRERASRIGAKFSLDTALGEGTVVTVRVPKATAFEANGSENSIEMDRMRIALRGLRDLVTWARRLGPQ
jgi:signal transduction histidine kinase/ligand-binding sensor domain-containing protein